MLPSIVPIPRISRGPLATDSSLVSRTLLKGRRPFTSLRPARTISTLRKSFKWLPIPRAIDCLHFLKEVLHCLQRRQRSQLSSPRLQKILHKPGRNGLETGEHFKIGFQNTSQFSERDTVSLEDNKKLSHRTFLGYKHSFSIPFKEAFDINFADWDFSLLAKARFHLSPPTQKEGPQMVSQITLWRISRPSILETEQLP